MLLTSIVFSRVSFQLLCLSMLCCLVMLICVCWLLVACCVVACCMLLRMGLLSLLRRVVSESVNGMKELTFYFEAIVHFMCSLTVLPHTRLKTLWGQKVRRVLPF